MLLPLPVPGPAILPLLVPWYHAALGAYLSQLHVLHCTHSRLQSCAFLFMAQSCASMMITIYKLVIFHAFAVTILYSKHIIIMIRMFCFSFENDAKCVPTSLITVLVHPQTLLLSLLLKVTQFLKVTWYSM